MADLAVGYVGEDGILPGVSYQLNTEYKFIPTIDSLNKFGFHNIIRTTIYEFLDSIMEEPEHLKFIKNHKCNDCSEEINSTILNYLSAHKISR